MSVLEQIEQVYDELEDAYDHVRPFIKYGVMFVGGLYAISPLAKAHLPRVEAFVKYKVKNFMLKDKKKNIHNVCGDLTCEDKAYAWYQEDYFAGAIGESKLSLGFSDSEYGFADYHFINAYGNRAFPYQTVNRETVELLSLKETVMLSADVMLERFIHNNTHLRMALVIHITSLKYPSMWIEADLKNSPITKALMPHYGKDNRLDIYTDLPLNEWVSLNINMTEWASKFGITDGIVDACSLVVENFYRGTY